MEYSCAVIGLGNIGFQYSLKFARDPKNETWCHVDAYNKCAHTKCVAAVEINPEQTKIFKGHHPEIPVYASIEELFANHQIDLVSIATPIEEHYPHIKKLLNFPVKGIFCEKPLAASIEKAYRAVQECEEKEIVLAVNHTRRWDNRYRLVRQMIEKGEIGEVQAVNAVYPAKIFNVGTHLFDTIRMLIQKNPARVSGVLVGGPSADPSISGWIEFEDGVPCSVLTMNRPMDLIFEIDVIGDKGRVRIVDNGERIEFLPLTESPRYPGARELKVKDIELRSANDRFVTAVEDIVAVMNNEKEKVACSGTDGLWALMISMGMVSSVENNGKSISIDLNDLISAS